MTQDQGQLAGIADGHWDHVARCDPRAVALADRHYSRQTIGARDFMPPGRVLVLLSRDGGAVWGACENLDPVGRRRWRVTIFRRESGPRSSDLIREATTRTVAYWRRRFGEPEGVHLETEINPEKTRHKRDPGRCFLRAGWIRIEERNGLVILRYPT